MKLEDVKVGAWVVYTAGHPRYPDVSRIGQIGRIRGFNKHEDDRPDENKNIDVEWMTVLHPCRASGGVFRENIELLGPVE